MAYRIFVVEDYPAAAWLLDGHLTFAGFQVITAANGLEALQRMRRQTPDLVLLDVSMPVMDGFALARRIRQDAWLARVPILFLTALAELPSKVEGFRAGGDDYVVKPFAIQEVLARVRALLRRCEIPDNPQRDLVRCGECSLDLADAVFEAGGKRTQLTSIEADLLRSLMIAPGMPVSAQHLLHDVLDYPPKTGDPSLVRGHIMSLRRKIEPDPDGPHYVQTLSGRGYRFYPSPGVQGSSAGQGTSNSVEAGEVQIATEN